MAKKDLTSFVNTFKKFTIISIHDTLTANNNFNELPFVLGEDSKKDLKQICRDYKKKYNEKLHYKFKDGIYYFSLEEIKWGIFMKP